MLTYSTYDSESTVPTHLQYATNEFWRNSWWSCSSGYLMFVFEPNRRGRKWFIHPAGLDRDASKCLSNWFGDDNRFPIAT